MSGGPNGFRDSSGDVLGGITDPSSTEEVPATPGWVESELDEIFAALPQRPAVTAARSRYAECLAASTRGAEAAHDRCRRDLLEALVQDGVRDGPGRELERRLEALEAEITART